MGGAKAIRQAPIRPCSFELVGYVTGTTATVGGRAPLSCLPHTPAWMRGEREYSHRAVFRDEVQQRDRCATCGASLADVRGEVLV